MSKEELIEELTKIYNGDVDGYSDCEWDHIQADTLLLEYINDDDVTNAFDQIHKWYS